MKKLMTLCLLTAVTGATANLASAQSTGMKDMDMNSMDMKSPPTAAKGAPTTHSGVGIVKSVDPAGATITFAHEPIKSLNWPAMTMGFKVKDKSLLDKVKPGEKVTFTLAQSGKDYVVTSVK
jgi:Cu(I)/Ag(I) efflux system protein CusF